MLGNKQLKAALEGGNTKISALLVTAAAALGTEPASLQVSDDSAQNFEAAVSELENALGDVTAGLGTAQADLATAKADLTSAKSELETAKADLASAKADLEEAKADKRTAEDALAANKDDFETKVQTEVENRLATAAPDIAVASAAAAEEAVTDFEAAYTASRKKGGAAHSKFLNDNKQQIADYFASQQ